MCPDLNDVAREQLLMRITIMAALLGTALLAAACGSDAGDGGR